MKINKIFHTLYFMVMFLPLFIIPIFAININQKSVEPISIEVQEKIAVDFNQQINIDDVRFGNDGGTSIRQNHQIVFTNNSLRNGAGIYLYADLTLNSKYYVYFQLQSDYASFNCNIRLGTNVTTNYYNYDVPNSTLIVDDVIQYSNNAGGMVAELELNILNGQLNSTFTYSKIMIIDLTKMYGTDNEPTLQEFNDTFNGEYFEQVESQKMLVNKATPTTYDNTDIGSQFLYSIYKPVNDYFNFKQYFGMNAIYDWFQLNFFNGTAPLSFFIFFNLMIYWLIISMLWLLFDVLIYVPLMIHRWLDKASIS